MPRYEMASVILLAGLALALALPEEEPLLTPDPFTWFGRRRAARRQRELDAEAEAETFITGIHDAVPPDPAPPRGGRHRAPGRTDHRGRAVSGFPPWELDSPPAGGAPREDQPPREPRAWEPGDEPNTAVLNVREILEEDLGKYLRDLPGYGGSKE